MARPALFLSPDAEAMWEELCARWQAGSLTVPEICVLLEYSERVVYRRLHDAEQRIEVRKLDANQAAHDRKSQPESQGPPDRDGPPEPDEAAFLCLTDDPRDLIRPYRDYSRDDIHGEEAYRQREYYCVNTLPAHEALNPHDATSLDARGGPVLVGGGAIRYDSAAAGRLRLPSPPLAGQRLRRNRLGTGNRAEPGGPTSTPEATDGRKGGTEAKDKDAEPPTWRVIGEDGSVLKVKGKGLREAKRAVKRLLNMAMSEPLPPGVRFCREG